MKVKLVWSKRSMRRFRKLPLDVKEKLCERIKIFEKDPFDSRLKTHRLKGKLHGYFSFSLNYSYRVIFRTSDEYKNHFEIIDIGTHSVYE